MPAEPVSVCPGCGLALARVDHPTHKYLGASPACWQRYGELLARELSDLRYPPWHRLTVDAYAVQHPGRPQRHTIQSVAGHLMSLCLVLERDMHPPDATRMIGPLLGRPRQLRWLDPPVPNGTITVLDVLTARRRDEHESWTYHWAEDIWTCWSPHHTTIRTWLDGLSASAAAS